MRLITGLHRRRSIAIALIVASFMVGGVAVWRASKLPAEASSRDKQQLQERWRKGVGSEVRFASVDATSEELDDAVGSTAEFIYWRSGLKMSDETRKKMVEAEGRVLRGEARYIAIEELTDKITTAAADRLATLTDVEIQQATEVSSDENGEIWTRADGKWGVLTKKGLIQQARAGRQWSQQDDSALRSSLRSMIEGEVNDCTSKLGAALPKQFGQASVRGVTPTQALLIAYAVAADDPLTDSRSDIEQILLEKRMNAGQTREQKKAQKDVTGRPYGPHGLLHPSAPYLFLNNGAVDTLLNLSEEDKPMTLIKGGKK